MRKPPLGVLPFGNWRMVHPEPGIDELLERYKAVRAAVVRFRDAGMEPNGNWIRELFGEIWE